MDSVRLTVQTNTASDPVTRKPHTAYTVFLNNCSEGVVRYAQGWTLQDAIRNYCDWFQTDRCCIKLIRPFRPQGWDKDEYRG